MFNYILNYGVQISASLAMCILTKDDVTYVYIYCRLFRRKCRRKLMHCISRVFGTRTCWLAILALTKRCN
jgi:hypothetical protein